MENTGIIEFVFLNRWMIGMFLLLGLMTICTAVSDRRKGDSWTTILKRYI